MENFVIICILYSLALAVIGYLGKCCWRALKADSKYDYRCYR